MRRCATSATAPSAVAAATTKRARCEGSTRRRPCGRSGTPRRRHGPRSRRRPWRLAAERVAVPRGRRTALAPRPGLLRALVALAREDSVAAGSLLAGLLPAQGAILDDDVSYDLTVRGLGTFAVTVRDGDGEVQRIARRRPRREAAFHLVGRAARARRAARGRAAGGSGASAGAGVKVNGRRKRVRALAPLPTARPHAGRRGPRGRAARASARLPRAAVRGRARMDARTRVHGRAGDRRVRPARVVRHGARRGAAGRRRARRRRGRGRDGDDDPRRVRSAARAASRRPRASCRSSAATAPRSRRSSAGPSWRRAPTEPYAPCVTASARDSPRRR